MEHWKKQIVVEPIALKVGDVAIVNAARASFDVQHEKIEEGDDKLINYLAREDHNTPFRHPRHCLTFGGSQASNIENDLEELADMCLENPFFGAGIVFGKFDVEEAELGLSVFSMVKIVKGMPTSDLAGAIGYWLCQNYPLTAAAFGLDYGPPPEVVTREELNSKNPWMHNESYRLSVPITVARQLVKHAVAMPWNECSRRYVSSAPEFFKQELRKAPEGNIKQGSGEVVSDFDVPPVLQMPTGIPGVSNNVDHNTITNDLAYWYQYAIKSAGLAPETVRGYMPLNMMTTIVWSGPPPAWDNVISQRKDPHAQIETSYFADKLIDARKRA